MEEIKASLDRYVNHKIPTGGFLEAVLSNDLAGAVGRADSINIQRIPEIVKYVYNNLPSNCWGDSETVTKWLSNSW